MVKSNYQNIWANTDIWHVSAAAQGHAHILQWLKDNGANMNLRNIAGKTPLDVARRFGNRNCVKTLGGNPGNC